VLKHFGMLIWPITVLPNVNITEFLAA